MATHPVLARQLQTPLVSVLQEALASHRYALDLDPENADTLFNTAHVLTSFAEEISKDDDPASERLALEYVVEALELLQRCHTLQEFHYTEFQKQLTEALQTSRQTGGEVMAIDESPEPQEGRGNGSAQEQWASIVEPTTRDTLIDTVIAQLSTLTTLCGMLGPSPKGLDVPSLAWVEEYSSKLLNVRLPLLAEGTDRSVEIGVAKAGFMSAVLEAGYRSEEIDLQTYRHERDAAFSGLPTSTSFAAGMANAASLFAFSNALSDKRNIAPAPDDLPSLRWDALATAISQLATASKLSDVAPEDLARTHFLRGDASLYQYQLSQPPLSYSPALKNRAALLKNAEVFYRNASRLMRDDEERDRGRVQEALVILLDRNAHAGRVQLEAIVARRGDQWLQGHINDMVADELLSDHDLHMVGLRA